MSHRIKLRVTKTPDPAASLASKEIRPSRWLLRRIFGTSRPRHKMAILLPGSETANVQVTFAKPNRDGDGLLDVARAADAVKRGDES